MTSSVANSSDDYASIRSRMYQMDVDSVEVCYSIPQWGWIGLVAEFNHKGANFYMLTEGLSPCESKSLLLQQTY